MGRQSMLYHINKVLRILTDDGRELIGKLLVFDKHMNVVLSNVTEKRNLTKKMKKEGVDPTRQLGLILLRGEHVVSVTVMAGDEGDSKLGGVSKSRDTGSPQEGGSGANASVSEEGHHVSRAPTLNKSATKKRAREE